jgi:hypothetical protein
MKGEITVTTTAEDEIDPRHLGPDDVLALGKQVGWLLGKAQADVEQLCADAVLRDPIVSYRLAVSATAVSSFPPAAQESC